MEHNGPYTLSVFWVEWIKCTGGCLIHAHPWSSTATKSPDTTAFLGGEANSHIYFNPQTLNIAQTMRLNGKAMWENYSRRQVDSWEILNFSVTYT